MAVKRKSEQDIMSARIPEDIFTLDPYIIEEEKEEYLKRFQSAEYRAIRNFVVTRKILLLYEEAIEKINGGSKNIHEVQIRSIDGKEYNIHFSVHQSFKLGHMYMSSKYVIYIVEGRYKKYYENYISKTRSYHKPNKNIWNTVQYMVPDVEMHFETDDGNYCIFIKKPCDEMYSLREILEYFGGKLKPEYVSSILTRLYYFANYMSLVETTHNAITLDSLFFAPGRRTEEGEEYTVNDMRIVGVYGGWFFSTYFNEKMSGVPKEVYEIIPEDYRKRGYSSFEVDALSIKQVAKKLLGTENGVPKPFIDWINASEVAKDPITEFHNWDKVIVDSFGKRRFVEIDVSI